MQAGKECNVLEHRCNLTNYVPQKKGVPFGDIAGLQIPKASVTQHKSAQAQGEGMLLYALVNSTTHTCQQTKKIAKLLHPVQGSGFLYYTV